MDKSCSLADFGSFIFSMLDQKYYRPKCCHSMTTSMAAGNVSPDMTLTSYALRWLHFWEESEENIREKHEGVWALEQKKVTKKSVRKKRCAWARTKRVRRGVCEGVNKVRRAVARTTTNPKLGLEPSQHPTHPSFASSVVFFFLHPTVGQPKPQSNECSACFCSLNGAAV